MKVLAGIVGLLATVAVTGQADAQTFRPCRINTDAFAFHKGDNKTRAQQLEDARCKAVDALHQEWAATVDGIARAREEASNAASAGRWDAFRKAVENAKPHFELARKAAEENQQLYGSADLLNQLSTGLVYIFKNSRLKEPLTLEEAFAEIDRAAQVEDERDRAATVFGVIAGNTRGNLITFVGGLKMKVDKQFADAAKIISDQALAQTIQDLSKVGTNAAQQPSTPSVTSAVTDALTAAATASATKGPDPADSWLWGMGERVQRFSAVASWAGLAFVLGMVAVAFRRARVVQALAFTAMVFVLGLAVWVVYVALPVAVPYLGPLAVAVCMMLLGPVRAFFGTGRGDAWIRLPSPQLALAALVVSGMVCMVIAFALPSWLSGFLGAALVMLLGWNLMENLPLSGFRRRSASPPPAAGMGLDGLTVADDILHGSAGWGGYDDAKKGGHLTTPGAEPGFALGRLDAIPAGVDERFRFLGHVLTCAPTGAGKGVGAVIPNLLEYPGSALVLDIKGENYAVTARRRRELGHQVFVIDPFGITGDTSAGCNFMDRLDLSNPDCISRSAALAECLVIASKGENSHFDETARGLLQGLMLYVAGLPDPELRHLGEVRRLLTLDEEGFEIVMAHMVSDPDAAYGVPCRAANTLMSTGDRERGSILSTARRSTAFLDDPRIIETLSRTDFDFSRLKTELITVYLVIPPNRLEFYFRYLRGFIGTALGALTDTQKKPQYRVAFFLDEFAQLGRMQSIEKAISLVRGYGIVFWLFVQDLSQLKDAYDDKWQTFMANSAKQFFGTDDFDTAEYITKTLGKATVEFETAGSSRKITELAGTNSENTQYTGRDLLTPDEVMRLGSKPIIIVRGEPPYMLERLDYRNDPEYANQHDPNPYH